MYEEFFGLSERPFELTVRPRFVFLTPGHREALATLQYGVTTRRALTLVLGDAGTGKTTLAYAAMDGQRGRDITPVYLGNPTLTRQEFFEWLASRFQLSASAQGSKFRLLDDLEQTLAERRARGNPWVLLVDEAQSLPDELLEELRLLTNIERGEEKLLPIVMLGQPEFGERLNHPAMRPLKQRVAVRCVLGPLSARETAAYVAKRISVAGGNGLEVFTREAVELIHRRSGGIPRAVNVLCDNALLSGFAVGRKPVDAAVVDEVSADLDLGVGEPEPPRATPAQRAPAPPAAAQAAARNGNGGVAHGQSHAPAHAPAPRPAPPMATSQPVSPGASLFKTDEPKRRKRFFFF